jgi:uridine monophosphate synthetase
MGAYGGSTGIQGDSQDHQVTTRTPPDDPLNQTLALATALHGAGAVRFGDFVLKDGRHSPFYLDLRVLVGVPSVLRQAAHAMLDVASRIRYDCIAGIPYAGLPIAVAMALEGDTPLVYPRKEAKAHGTGRMVEGVFQSGDRALVIDDVITTGGAKLEAITPLRSAGLTVEDILVVVDREQSGASTLAKHGIRLHSVLRVRELLATLHASGAITDDQLKHALDFVAKG